MSTKNFYRSVSETVTLNAERKARRSDKRGMRRRVKMELDEMRRDPVSFEDWVDERGKKDYSESSFHATPIVNFIRSRTGQLFADVMTELRGKLGRHPKFRFFLESLHSGIHFHKGWIKNCYGIELWVDEDGVILTKTRSLNRSKPALPQADVERWSVGRLVFSAKDGLRWAIRYEYSYIAPYGRSAYSLMTFAYRLGERLTVREIIFWERLSPRQRGRKTCAEILLREPEREVAA